MNNNNGRRFQSKYIYRGICCVLMTLLAAMSFFCVWFNFVKENNQTGHLLGAGNLLMSLGIYFILYLIIGNWLKAFRIGVDRKANLLASQVLTLFVTDVLEIFISCAITGQFRFFNSFLSRYFVLFICQSVVLCIITVLAVNRYRKLFPPLQVLEIYEEDEHHLLSKVNSRPDKYHIVKVMKVSEGFDRIFAEMEGYDAVLINDIPSEDKNTIIKECFEKNKRVYFTPKISDIISKSAVEINLFDTPLYLCRNNGVSMIQLVVKRIFDIIISAAGLIITSPILLITAIAIKLEDHGPVFFRQERGTIDGRPFMILKFRSMIVDAEKDGRPHPAGEDDDRITKVGRIIRPFRIDELPQLVNILKGEMSLVGPRPERLEHIRKYTEQIPEFAYRTKVLAGLTGVAQCYGRYNSTALDKLKMDLYYITNYSLLLDLQILFETLKILVQKESTEGFSEEQQEEMQDAI